MEPSEPTELDHIALHKEFLENSDFFMFDSTDEDEQKLLRHNLSIKEIIFIAWVRHIYRDVVLVNKSKIIGIGGFHRAGKSEWACTMAYCWDPTFFPRIKQRVMHTTAAFAAEIEYVREHDIHGAVFIIDEGGVVAPSDAFYEEWYKELNQSIQVMGYLNPIIIFCAVIRDNIGAKFRKLYNIQCKAKRFDNECSKIKILDLNYDDLRGKTTPKRPHIRIFGKKYIMDGVKFGKPPAFISKAYQAIANPAKDKLLKQHAVASKDREARGPAKSKREQQRNEQTQFIDSKIPDIVSKFQQYGAARSRPGAITLDPVKIQAGENVPIAVAKIMKIKAEEFLNKK